MGSKSNSEECRTLPGAQPGPSLSLSIASPPEPSSAWNNQDEEHMVASGELTTKPFSPPKAFEEAAAGSIRKAILGEPRAPHQPLAGAWDLDLQTDVVPAERQGFPTAASNLLSRLQQQQQDDKSFESVFGAARLDMQGLRMPSQASLDASLDQQRELGGGGGGGDRKRGEGEPVRTTQMLLPEGAKPSKQLDSSWVEVRVANPLAAVVVPGHGGVGLSLRGKSLEGQAVQAMEMADGTSLSAPPQGRGRCDDVGIAKPACSGSGSGLKEGRSDDKITPQLAQQCATSTRAWGPTSKGEPSTSSIDVEPTSEAACPVFPFAEFDAWLLQRAKQSEMFGIVPDELYYRIRSCLMSLAGTGSSGVLFGNDSFCNGRGKGGVSSSSEGGAEDLQFIVDAHEKFRLVNDPSINHENVVFMVDKDGGTKRLVPVREIGSVLHNLHAQRPQHAAYTAVSTLVTRGYVGIPLAAIKQFVKMCPLCTQKADSSGPQALVKSPALPVNGLWGRMQLQLVDMRVRPDGEFQWILCAKDEWSRFCFLAPLRSASADEVALQLILWFRLIGPPTILQGPGPKEEQFMVDVIRACQRLWPGLAVINGRVPEFMFQTQGQRNVEAAYVLRCIDSSGRNNWASLLPEIQWNKNTMWKDELQACPYEVALGCRPRLNLVAKAGIACHSDRVISETEVEDHVTYAHSAHDFEDDCGPPSTSRAIESAKRTCPKQVPDSARRGSYSIVYGASSKEANNILQFMKAESSNTVFALNT